MTTIETVQLMKFTGHYLEAWGRRIPATCVVRNELNGWRQPWQVVRTLGQTTPHGLAYQPRPFPPGVHEITRVADMGTDTEFWPMWIDTDATQELTVWKVDDQGFYLRKTGDTVTGKGYGIHHARYRKNGKLLRSNTTLGCINILSPDNAQWLGAEIRKMLGYRLHVMLEVPDWNNWED